MSSYRALANVLGHYFPVRWALRNHMVLRVDVEPFVLIAATHAYGYSQKILLWVVTLGLSDLFPSEFCLHMLMCRYGAKSTKPYWTMKTGSQHPNWLNSWSYCCGLKMSWTRRRWNTPKWQISAQAPSRTPSEHDKRPPSTSPLFIISQWLCDSQVNTCIKMFFFSYMKTI